MTTINVSPSGSPTLREAINSATSSDTIALATGTYDINSLAKQTSITPAPTPGSGYSIAGASIANTIITDALIYQYNTADYSPGTVQDLTLSYSSASRINGEYLLNVWQGSWTIKNVKFTGALTGSDGSSGAYMFCRGGSPEGGPYAASNVTLDGIDVDLKGQSDFDGTTGGSSFIQSFFNSGSITITNSIFDESGYSDAFTLLSTGSATITGNTFKRTTNKTVRSEGETIIDTTATVSGNTFSDGAYLQLGYSGNTSSKIVTVSGNTFNTINDGSNQGAGLVLVQGSALPNVVGNAFKGNGTAFRYISSAVGSRRIGTGVGSGGSNTVEIGGMAIAFSTLTSGGQNNDTITGTANNDWINGDDGNDTINGGSGNDYLYGGDGNDSLNGGTGVDTLIGGAGNDNLIGAAGADILTGGQGADQFTYTNSGQGRDTITDFSGATGSGQGDTLRFQRSAFGNIPIGSLTPTTFRLNTASGTNAQFIYNTTTGVLTYDSNGTSAGGNFNMAILTGAPTLTATDIVMF